MKNKLITDGKLEKRSTMCQNAEADYDSRKERDYIAAKKFNAKISNIHIWGILILFLTIVDITVYHTLFLDLDLPRETAMALTLLMAVLLQFTPALTGLCLEAITQKWSVFRKSKGAATMIIVVILIAILGTAGGLWSVTTMRLLLYETGNEFYGQTKNYFAILAPFLTSFLAFISTFVFFPSDNIIDFLVRKADPLIAELGRAKREAYVLEHGDVAYYRNEVNEARADLKKVKRDVWNGCSVDGVEVEMPEEFEEFERVCAKILNEVIGEKRRSVQEAALNYLDSFNNHVIRLLDSCLAMVELKSRERGYPEFLADELSNLTSDKIIQLYNESVGNEQGMVWNSEERRQNFKRDLCNQLSIERRKER